MNNRYPIFIPSKGRFETRYTIKAFDAINVPYSVVVEPQEYDRYLEHVDQSRLIVLPFSDRGLVATRNWIWDHAQSLGVDRFWTFDDNIRIFYRLHQNARIPLLDGTFLAVIEDFVDRYENVYIAGMHYRMFASSREKKPPLILNTRVYSNMLIQTNIPYRNRGIYNDDTDLCLRVLKDGYCTILFYAFLVDKLQTMTIRGGMTAEYQGDGRLRMAQELQARHPDVTKISWKWGRWQHHVDYRPFKGNRLIRKPDIVIPDGVDNYGMKLIRINNPSLDTLNGS